MLTIKGINDFQFVDCPAIYQSIQKIGFTKRSMCDHNFAFCDNRQTFSYTTMNQFHLINGFMAKATEFILDIESMSHHPAVNLMKTGFGHRLYIKTALNRHPGASYLLDLTLKK